MTGAAADALRRSPLLGIELPEGLREVPFLVQVDVRLEAADEPARTAVESVVGALPTTPNTVHGGADAAVLWLGPDEWLFIAAPGSGDLLESRLRAAAAEAGPGVAERVAVVDVSANRTTLELDHPAAREILAGGCPLDLHPRAFGPGQCAQTLVARANVILCQLPTGAGGADAARSAGTETAHPAGDPPRYRLLVRPSFAAYLAAWLADALGG